jgi:hypothetical protein
MRLAVTGYQDTFLTGDPQQSFYQKVFTKRAGYTTENLRLAFDSDINYGRTSICTIDNDTCDIITAFIVNFTFQESQTVPQDAGHAFIERAELLVGGQTIMSLTGEYMAVMSDLTDSQRTRGNNDSILKRNVTPTSYGTTSVANQFLVELPFFGKGYANAFPLLALNRHTIEVKITLRTQAELGSLPVPDVVLDLQAIYLKEEHRQFFLGKQLDYVIQQTQLARVTVGDLEQMRFKTEIENPVKEFILVVQNDSGTDGVFDYSSHKSTTYTSYLNDQVTRWRLFLNGQVYFDLDQMSMRAIQPYEYYIQTPSYKVNIFNVGEGTVNTSRISSQIFELTLVNNSISRKARLYAVNYNIFRCQGGLGGTLFA